MCLRQNIDFFYLCWRKRFHGEIWICEKPVTSQLNQLCMPHPGPLLHLHALISAQAPPEMQKNGEFEGEVQ